MKPTLSLSCLNVEFSRVLLLYLYDCTGVPVLVVCTCLSGSSCVAVPLALWSRQGRMCWPDAQVRLPLAGNVAMWSVSVR